MHPALTARSRALFRASGCLRARACTGDAEPPQVPDVRIACTLFVACAARDVDAFVFHALNQSSIVYDGRLIVDENWTTNDPLILAGGTIAKLARRVGILVKLPSPPF